MQRFGLFDEAGFPQAYYAEDINGPLNLPIFAEPPAGSEEGPAAPTEIIGHERNLAIPDGVVPLTDDQWLEFINNSGLRRWNGTGIEAIEPPEPLPTVPAAISDRQFAQVLALDGVITKPEALAWAARGELPQKVKDALIQIPEADGQRFGAEMMLSAATVYERGHPLVPTLGALLGYDAAALDDLWTRGAAL